MQYRRIVEDGLVDGGYGWRIWIRYYKFRNLEGGLLRIYRYLLRTYRGVLGLFQWGGPLTITDEMPLAVL